MIILLTWSSSGAEGKGQDTAGCAEEVGPCAVGNSGPDNSGQIEPGSALAVKIDKARKIKIITSSGDTEIQRPVILAGGVTAANDPLKLIPWTAIQKIRIRERSTLTGTLIGLGVGVASGVGLAADYGASSDRYVLASLIFGAAGALEGAIIGSLIKHWKTVYAAPAGPSLVARFSLAPARRGGMVTLTLAF
ncbi:MAG: hypothetical protein ACXW2O_07270 [Candidatus Aminicenantales bacterium]